MICKLARNLLEQPLYVFSSGKEKKKKKEKVKEQHQINWSVKQVQCQKITPQPETKMINYVCGAKVAWKLYGFRERQDAACITDSVHAHQNPQHLFKVAVCIGWVQFTLHINLLLRPASVTARLFCFPTWYLPVSTRPYLPQLRATLPATI